MSLRDMVHAAADVIASKRETDPRLADALYAAASVAVKHRRPKDIATLGNMLEYAGAPLGVGSQQTPDPSNVDLDKLRGGIAAMRSGVDDAKALFSRYDDFKAQAGDWHDDLVTTAATSARSAVQALDGTLAAVASALSQSDPLGLLGQLDQSESASTSDEAVGQQVPPQFADIVQRVKSEVREAATQMQRFSNALISAAVPESLFQQAQGIGQALSDTAAHLEDSLDRALEAFGFGATTSVLVLLGLGLAGVYLWSHH